MSDLTRLFNGHVLDFLYYELKVSLIQLSASELLIVGTNYLLRRVVRKKVNFTSE
jgi:hypothetical protein